MILLPVPTLLLLLEGMFGETWIPKVCKTMAFEDLFKCLVALF